MSQGAAPYGILLLLLTALLATKVVGDNPVWDLNVATVAGSSAGFQNGVGTAAKFNQPHSVLEMANGNILVADFDNNRIRMVTPDGTVTTLAGSGARGYYDGPGATAQFNQPEGLAMMQNGSVVVSEWGQRLRLVAPDGKVTTLAGTGVWGSTDGPGNIATFARPSGMDVLPNGNIVLAEFGTHLIRIVSPDGTVSTLTGTTGGSVDGPRATAQLNAPVNVAVMPNGSIVVAEWSGHRIRLVAPDGSITTLAGSGTQGFLDGPGKTAQFSAPRGVAVLKSAHRSGYVLIGDQANNRIRLISLVDGTVSTLVGSSSGGSVDGPRVAATFNWPCGVREMPDGTIAIADNNNNRIRLITFADTSCTILADCSNHASSVSGTVQTGCSCTCSTGYSGASCNTCTTNYGVYPSCEPLVCTVSEDCHNHATSVSGTRVSGCTCTCATGYTGATCSDCTNNYYGYPSCVPIPCTIATNCNSHASSVSGNLVDGCSCTCSTGYTGATCDACATNYGGPSCEPLVCTVDEDCHDHATSVSGTRVSGCTCTCATGYTGATCSDCTNNYYGYPSCVPIPCTIATNCNSHASSVSGNLVDGCSCTCSTGYTGATCDACATNYGGPSCEPLVCTVDEDCNSHATSVSGTRVSGCTCTCSTEFNGATCEKCATNYDYYPNCSAIPCTSAADCNGHAASVSGTLISGCTCTCATGYTGLTCDSCATHYENYPACQPIPCYVGCDCSWHASSVSGNIVAGCVCECRKGYAGAKCDQCATNFENYPSCTEVTCTNVDNCHGHADTVSGTPSTGCTCVCTSGFGWRAMQHVCRWVRELSNVLADPMQHQHRLQWARRLCDRNRLQRL